MARASGRVELSQEEVTALNNVCEGTNKFAVKLFRALSKENPGNIFVSPLSVQMVLALAYTGAKGETADEIATLLSLPENIKDTYIGYHSLIKILQAPVLKLANRIFLEKTKGVKEDFQREAQKYFESPAEALDFIHNYEKSREHINAWVENQTNKKITNLLQPGVISADTRLVLVNAIHFKADWEKQFSEVCTKEQPFHVSKTETVQVKMMHHEKKFRFTHDDELKAKILIMDYKGRDFSMVVILPDDIEGLPALEKRLETIDLSSKVRDMDAPTVIVAMPKFKMEETMELNTILKSLGAKAMFDQGKADFSGLSSESLVVSYVVQKAFVEVDEKGTEAAACTAVRMQLCASWPEPRKETFIADHPFVFFITSRYNNTTLFFGRCSMPSM